MNNNQQCSELRRVDRSLTVHNYNFCHSHASTIREVYINFHSNCINIETPAPTDYHQDITRVCKDFKRDAVLCDNSRLPGINIAPSLARSPSHTLDASVCATPSSSSQSEVEVSGSLITTPTGAILSLHNHTAKHTQEPQGQHPHCLLTINQRVIN